MVRFFVRRGLKDIMGMFLKNLKNLNKNNEIVKKRKNNGRKKAKSKYRSIHRAG